ncbi:SDR family NAD(P)-dependent oxidoreductase [Aurantiacibacter sp. D1-12]|uniref:SDR family NAD(P)-dependent oxidoreductase n=1 Tax=Aurantiacibacter sp. D1-12 TaxID=2993658 RepID=UPI00237C7752|nr:SDR family oxidoreductase [Aurantiacibacter sp. D1-12]MDE1467093.1 SDR family oxidoreductase [Aurantiacibacter sp. D1-12]
MTYDFSGKTALVTGAASGIGAACAKLLAEGGVAKLILVDINKEPLEAFNFDCETVIHAGDVADEALWDGIEAAGGTIDLAVLNAGIPGDGEPIAKMSLDNWRRVMSVNLDGAFLSLRTSIRMAKKGTSIVLTSSVTAVKPEMGIAHYASSKAAVKHLTKVAAKECASRGIRVNAIAPGGTDTGIWDGAPFFEDLVEKHQGDRAGAIATMAAQVTPMGRFATSEEMAGQIMFLLSDAAAFTTGSTLVADGGFRL